MKFRNSWINYPNYRYRGAMSSNKYVSETSNKINVQESLVQAINYHLAGTAYILLFLQNNAWLFQLLCKWASNILEICWQKEQYVLERATVNYLLVVENNLPESEESKIKKSCWTINKIYLWREREKQVD